MIDGFKHQGLRKEMIANIRAKGINDAQVLDAMQAIPRHFFLDKAFLEFAYVDKAFPIAAGQTISQPYTVAYQTHLLHVQRGDKILEIGTGSGYQTSVLCAMGAKVFSIERQRELFDKTKKLFELHLPYKPKLFYGDGFKGQIAFAPYDKIIVTCGAPSIPQALLEQLRIGGVLVCPTGVDVQIMTTVIKQSATKYETIELGSFKFVPMLQNKA
ncbi:MAG: protein-L-isoaspartate(D-aspartate) O-methyltransferase [Bacteroidia bacterium]|nr:protein-L-isoaspartate(D-aspartate) O-methyltransferase [Bacteroidia bacterium]